MAALDRVIRDGSRASDVISGIRNLVKKAPPCKEPTDLNDLIRHTLNLTAGEVARNRVQLDTSLAGKLPSIIADRGQIQQVLLNLIMNAVDAMGPIHDRPRRLEVSSRRLDEPLGVRATVKDNGVGLGDTDRERIFNPFFTTKPNGMGLGLSICRTIIGAHGGHLALTENSDHGVSAEFMLPVGVDALQ